MPTDHKHLQYDMHAATRVFSSKRARSQLACVGMTDVAIYHLSLLLLLLLNR